jgi:hypothetical protein
MTPTGGCPKCLRPYYNRWTGDLNEIMTCYICRRQGTRREFSTTVGDRYNPTALALAHGPTMTLDELLDVLQRIRTVNPVAGHNIITFLEVNCDEPYGMDGWPVREAFDTQDGFYLPDQFVAGPGLKRGVRRTAGEQ